MDLKSKEIIKGKFRKDGNKVFNSDDDYIKQTKKYDTKINYIKSNLDFVLACIKMTLKAFGNLKSEDSFTKECSKRIIGTSLISIIIVVSLIYFLITILLGSFNLKFYCIIVEICSIPLFISAIWYYKLCKDKIHFDLSCFMFAFLLSLIAYIAPQLINFDLTKFGISYLIYHILVVFTSLSILILATASIWEDIHDCDTFRKNIIKLLVASFILVPIIYIIFLFVNLINLSIQTEALRFIIRLIAISIAILIIYHLTKHIIFNSVKINAKSKTPKTNTSLNSKRVEELNNILFNIINEDIGFDEFCYLNQKTLCKNNHYEHNYSHAKDANTGLNWYVSKSSFNGEDINNLSFIEREAVLLEYFNLRLPYGLQELDIKNIYGDIRYFWIGLCKRNGEKYKKHDAFYNKTYERWLKYGNKELTSFETIPHCSINQENDNVLLSILNYCRKYDGDLRKENNSVKSTLFIIKENNKNKETLNKNQEYKENIKSSTTNHFNEFIENKFQFIHEYIDRRNLS